MSGGPEGGPPDEHEARRAKPAKPIEHQALFAPPPFDADKYDARYSVEPKEISSERTARIKRDDCEACHERWRKTVTHFVVLAAFVIGLVVVAVICINIVRDPKAATNRFQWAAAALSSIISGATGYLAGKSKG